MLQYPNIIAVAEGNSVLALMGNEMLAKYTAVSRKGYGEKITSQSERIYIQMHIISSILSRGWNEQQAV